MYLYLIEKCKKVQCHNKINKNVLFIIIYLYFKWKDIILLLNCYLNSIKKCHFKILIRIEFKINKVIKYLKII
jgi:hypothetical protein